MHLKDIDPRAPCPYPPGSYGKRRWLRARARARRPLFLDTDAIDGADVSLRHRGPCRNAALVRLPAG